MEKRTYQNIKQKDKPMTAIPDLGQAHETCGGDKLVLLVPKKNQEK